MKKILAIAFCTLVLIVLLITGVFTPQPASIMYSSMKKTIENDSTSISTTPSNIIPFSEKFKRQNKGIKVAFQEGEVIQAKCIVQIKQEKIELLVTGMDVRHADTFQVSPAFQLQEKLKTFAGLPITFTLLITSEGQYLYSNMFSYSAEIINFHSNLTVNPTHVDHMEVKRTIVYEGIIKEVQEIDSDNSIIRLKTPVGSREVLVDSNIEYESHHQLENLHGQKPGIGDSVRIITRVCTYPFQNRFLRRNTEEKDLKKVAYAAWCRSLYLLSPSKKRLRKYQNLRLNVRTLLNRVKAAKSNKQKRVDIAILMNTQTTLAEKQEIKTIVSMMPKKERPILIWDRYTAKEIRAAFRINCDKLTKEEFHTFAKKVCQTPLNKLVNSRKKDESKVLDIAREMLSQKDFKHLLFESVKLRMSIFKNVDFRFNMNVYWNDYYFLSQSIKYLTLFQDKETIDLLLSITKESIKVLKDNPKSSLQETLYLGICTLRSIFFDTYKMYNKIMIHFESKYEEMIEIAKYLKNECRYSLLLEDLLFILSEFSPSYCYLNNGDFHENIMNIIRRESRSSKFFKLLLKKVREKGYRFISVTPKSSNVNAGTLSFFKNYSSGAVTAKVGKRRVYMCLPLIEFHSRTEEYDLKNFLLSVIANEGVHVMSSLTYNVLSRKKAITTLKAMSNTSTNLLPEEKILHAVITEEILSQVVSDIIMGEKLVLHSFEPYSHYGARMKQMKLQLGSAVFKRIFRGNDHSVWKYYRLAIPRLHHFLNSGKLEEQVVAKLQAFALLK